MVRELNLKFKLAIQQKGGVGIRALRRVFHQMDFNGNKKLDCQEFEQALAAYGIFPKKVELQGLMKYYDVDGDGSIGYEEFLSGLKDDMSERRVSMVKKCFSTLDRDGSGQIRIAEIANIYDVSMNPEFLEGRKTKDEILTEFLGSFEGARGNNDGVVTWEEFCDYYSDLGMSTPSDEYFVKMLECCWQVPELEDAETAKSTVKHLHTEVKSRIQQLARNDPSLYRKIFNDFDLNGSEALTIDEVTNLIAKLRISVERKYIYPFFKIVDCNNSGAIEFEEFEQYLCQ
jgi:Ca2+-binding EF-hand superfamily protein